MTLDEAVKAAERMIISYKRSAVAMETILKALKDSIPEADKETKVAEEAPTKEEPAKTYTFTEVRGIMAGLSGQGKKAEAKALLTKFGATRLSDVKEADYAALVQEAQVIANG